MPHASCSSRPALLIVDDDPQIRDLLTEYLDGHGFDVRAAADAAAARRCVAQFAPSIAILDVHLPGEDGLSLARWLHASHDDVGVLMLTTAEQAVDRVLGL